MTTDNQQSPVYVVQFGEKSSIEDTEWVLKKLTQSKEDGGAGLTVTSSPPSSGKDLTVFVSLSDDRIQSVGRQLKLKSHFDVSDSNEEEEIVYSSSDILLMIRHEINSVRASHKGKLPSAKVNLWQGQSIVEKLLHKGWIEKLYPLHEQEDLKRLSDDWYGLSSFNSLIHGQPLDKVRDYFGEGVAFYFGFLDTFTWSLIFPSVIGMIHGYYTKASEPPYSSMFTTHLFFCLLYLIWAFGFMERWKRRSNELSHQWGTHDVNTGTQKLPRANYKGHLLVDPVTAQLQPHYPRWKTLGKLYLVSLPIVIVGLLVAFYVMMLSVWYEADLTAWTSTWDPDDFFWTSCVAPVLVLLPSISYSIGVYFANLYYRQWTTRLTEWENHRTESQFERNRVTKLVLFEFVNNFMSLFYIAFYLQDIAMLRSQVVIMLFVNQSISQLQESLIPYLSQKRACKNLKDEKKAVNESLLSMVQNLKLPILEADDYRVVQADMEAMLEPYEGMHEDYLELYIQFGYILLFMVTYPMAAFWAWVNNVIELRVDAFKLVRTQRRPAVSRVGHIGAWQPAFNMMVSMAVVTNCALLYVMSEKEATAISASIAEDAVVDDTGVMSSWSRAMICVSMDHVLLGLQSLLGILVPSVPTSIRNRRR